MLSNKEILESLKEINETLRLSIAEIEKGHNVTFYKEHIKLSALNIFDKSQLLKDTEPAVKPPVEIKIIKKEESPVIDSKTVVIEPPVIKIPVKETVIVEKAEPIIVKEPAITPPTKPAPVIEVAKIAAPAEKPAVVNNEPEEDDSTVNGKIAKFKQPEINVADKLKDMPIKELVKAISISKKFEFINELFQGNAEAYKTCLQTVESIGSFEKAAVFLENEVADKLNWEENETLAAEFFLLVKRRYL